MIIKVLDPDNNWSWFSDVVEITKFGFQDPDNIDPKQYGVSYLDVVGNGDNDALIIRATFRNGSERMFAFYTKQAYLVNDKHGSTIDVLV